MTRTILLSAAALLLAATATTAFAAQSGSGIVGDDYSRYASIDGPNAPLMTSFAPNRDDALVTDLYGPFDYMFDRDAAMGRNDVQTAAASGSAGPTS